jgi:hypothetical protein
MVQKITMRRWREPFVNLKLTRCQIGTCGDYTLPKWPSKCGDWERKRLYQTAWLTVSEDFSLSQRGFSIIQSGREKCERKFI